MEVRKKVSIDMGENAYIIFSGGETAVVDPGSSAEEILKVSGEKIKYIILTHCHYDHITSLSELKEKTGAKIVFSKEAEKNLNDGYINLSEAVYGRNIGAEPDILVADGDKIKLGNAEILCISSPGHTNCGMCYFAEGKLFSGDTLFSGSVGRWDLPTGDGKVLIKTIKEKLFSLPDETVVYPGHGSETTIGHEKKHNFYVNN